MNLKLGKAEERTDKLKDEMIIWIWDFPIVLTDNNSQEFNVSMYNNI